MHTAQNEEEACPLCKSDHYLNPKMRFMVSPCFHKICDGCVNRLFSSGSGPCPICGTSLRRGHWVIPIFEDVLVERECRVRKRLSTIFCRTAEDFVDLRTYNDYLEEIEDIVFNLVHDQDVQQMEAKLEAYRLANQDQIKRSLQRQTEEEQLIKAELTAEKERRKRAHEQALQDLKQDAQTAKEQQASFIKALETSNESAMEIQGRLAKQNKQLRTASSVARVVSIEDELPSLRGLKQRKGPNKTARSDNAVHVDPLETVPLLSLPESICAPISLASERALLYDGIDPFLMGSESDRMTAAGYSKTWLLKACWESAFSYGLGGPPKMSGNEIVNEFPATSAVLLAAAFVIEDACKSVNDQFMICKDKTEDPADCVPVGESVRDCVNTVFERIKKSPCQPLFERFWNCLDMNNQNFIYCREEEQAFHQCVNVNLGLKKRLWKGVKPEEGFKDEQDLPAWNSWRYRYHVWSHKR